MAKNNPWGRDEKITRHARAMDRADGMKLRTVPGSRREVSGGGHEGPFGRESGHFGGPIQPQRLGTATRAREVRQVRKMLRIENTALWSPLPKNPGCESGEPPRH